MKAIPPLLPCTLAAVHLFALSLLAEAPAPMSEAVSRLEASKTFGVTPSGSTNNNSSSSQPNVTGTKNEADISSVLDNDPFKSPLFAPPPPDALPQTPQPRPNRRYERTLTKEQEKEREKESNWLIHGVEEQTKLMEETSKSPLANDADNPARKAEAERNQSKLQEDGSRLDMNRKTERTAGGTLTNPLNAGLGIYSRYTLKGMEAMQQASMPVDPLSMDARDHYTPLKAAENPADSAMNAANIQSPILDPMASTKMTLNAKTPVATPNARLSVDDWLTAVKERERNSLLPQQAPTVQNFYDQYQVRPKAPEPKATPPPIVYNRPKAESMKNSIPPNRTIKDPNEF